jgi:acetylornithine deacetylase/succinyl-diaminopimelate desuccinylase-like protein
VTVAAADVDAARARAIGSVSAERVLDLLRLLVATPSPARSERALAEKIAEAGRREHPEIEWRVEPHGGQSASLVARSGSGSTRELAIYSHLDTSLTGDGERDSAITGTSTPPAAFVAEAGMLRGFGVGVAKGPAAAGAAAFLTAATALRELNVPHRLTLLLAAGGTHRAHGPEAGQRFGPGVAQLLASGWRPSAVLNVKGGPAGVLHEEPASAYLRVRIVRPWTAALARRSAAPDGGLARHAGRVVDAIEEWREAYLRAHPPSGQLACEIAIGAIRSGSPEKADLMPGSLEISVYAVLPPEEDVAGVARDLASHVRTRCADVAGAGEAEVDVHAYAPGGRGDGASEIARLARDADAAHRGASPPVQGWTGATDGASLLAAGIPTVRLGVRVTRDAADPRVEIVSLDELVACARAYVDVAIRYLATA